MITLFAETSQWMVTIYIPTAEVLSRIGKLGGGNFPLLPLVGGKMENVRKIALFQAVDHFVTIFPKAMGRNLKILKQYDQYPISPLTARENFSQKFLAVSEIDVLIWGHLASKMGNFS